MKNLKFLSILMLVLVLSLTACKNKHEHAYVGGKCECGEVDPNYVPPHVHEYESEVITPTCTEDGYTEHTCTCGESYKDSEVEALGHSYGEWQVVKEPTEEETGQKERICSCGEKETEVLPKLEHIHNFVEGVCKCGEVDPDYVAPIVGTPLEEIDAWIKSSYTDDLLIDKGVDVLPTTYLDKDVTITWVSSHPNRVDNTGKIVVRDTKKITEVTLTYTITNEALESMTGSLIFKLYPRSFDYMKSQFEGQFPERLQEDMSDYLETEFNKYFTITWESSDESVFTNEGYYIKPLVDTPVTITYRIEVDENHYIEDFFEMIVLGASDEEKLDIVSSWLQNEIIPDLNVTSDLTLPTSHPDHGTEIVWSTSNERVVSLDGKVTQYVFDRYIDLKAFIYSGDMIKDVTFWLKVKALDTSKMSEEQVLENFLSAIAEEELKRVTFDEYTNISQTFNSLFFFDNKWEDRIEYLIPLGAANRPGKKLASVEFIVCHDTANNNAGALGHAGYVTGSAAGSTSWHYSCGSDGIYHHVPNDEVAHHAGDGTSRGYKLLDSGIKATVERPNLTLDSEGYFCFNGVRSNLKKPSDAPANANITSSGLYYEIGPNGNYWLNDNWWSSTYRYIGNRGGNLNSIGIESMVDAGSDYMKTYRIFADLVAHLLIENNLDVLRVMQHNNISGKDCPAAIRDQGYWQHFRDLISLEKFGMEHFEGLTFEWKSGTDILSNDGYIAKVLNGVTEVKYSVVVKRNDNVVIAKEYTTKLIDS